MSAHVVTKLGSVYLHPRRALHSPTTVSSVFPLTPGIDSVRAPITPSIVFFCLSAKCWLSHNAALRAIALGYENVHWYRGGIKAWKKARLPTEKARKTTW